MPKRVKKIRLAKAPYHGKKLVTKSGIITPYGFLKRATGLEKLFAGSGDLWRPLNIRKKK